MPARAAEAKRARTARSAAGVPAQRLGVGEVPALDTEPLADQGDGAVELRVHRVSGQSIEEGMGVGVGADRDESRRDGVRQGGPAERGAAPGERSAAFDEVGRHVQGGGHPVPDQDGKRLLDEVGGAVVEGDDHRTGPRWWRPGQCGQRAVEVDHAWARHQPGHLLFEEPAGQVDPRCRAASDPVIAEDDESAPGAGAPSREPPPPA